MRNQHLNNMKKIILITDKWGQFVTLPQFSTIILLDSNDDMTEHTRKERPSLIILDGDSIPHTRIIELHEDAWRAIGRFDVTTKVIAFRCIKTLAGTIPIENIEGVGKEIEKCFQAN